jgi:tetratricopeptide (TPR) repeat protein
LGQDNEAIDDYQVAVTGETPSIAALNNLYIALARSGRLEEALAAIDRAVALDRASGTHQANRGECLLLLSRHEEATAALRHAIEDEQDHLEARVLLALMLWTTAPEAAVALCEQALRSQGEMNSPFRAAELRAIAKLLLGDEAAAEQILRDASARRLRSDWYQEPVYELLRSSGVAGVDRLIAVWRDGESPAVPL